MLPIFTMQLRNGRVVLSVYAVIDMGDGVSRFDYRGVGCGGCNVDASCISQLIIDTREVYKSARVIGQWPIGVSRG